LTGKTQDLTPLIAVARKNVRPYTSDSSCKENVRPYTSDIAVAIRKNVRPYTSDRSCKEKRKTLNP